MVESASSSGRACPTDTRWFCTNELQSVKKVVPETIAWSASSAVGTATKNVAQQVLGEHAGVTMADRRHSGVKEVDQWGLVVSSWFGGGCQRGCENMRPWHWHRLRVSGQCWQHAGKEGHLRAGLSLVPAVPSSW